ncbi:MAG: hypothetical protein AAF749_03905 [Pseudomonadota bacterium]
MAEQQTMLEMPVGCFVPMSVASDSFFAEEVPGLMGTQTTTGSAFDD